MSYTSVFGRWLEGPSMEDAFEADKPVSAADALTLANNLNHLRDTCTQQRVSYLTHVGQTITPTDFGGDAVVPTPVMQFTTPWSILEGERLARPVLRIGAHRNAAGTSYISAGLFARGARQNALGSGALAYWEETAFTNTSAAIVLEAAADITWRRSVLPPPRRFTLLGGGVTIPSLSLGSPTGVSEIGATDPLSDGSSAASAPSLLFAVLAIWVRHTGTSETRLSLVDLREFSGP